MTRFKLIERNMKTHILLVFMVCFVSCATNRNIVYVSKNISSNNSDITVSVDVSGYSQGGLLITKFYILNNSQSDLEINSRYFSLFDNAKSVVDRVTPDDVIDIMDSDQILSDEQKASLLRQNKRTWLNEDSRIIEPKTAIKVNMYWQVRTADFPLSLLFRKDNTKIVFVIEKQ